MRFAVSLIITCANVLILFALCDLEGLAKAFAIGMYSAVIAYAICEAAAMHGMF